MTASYTSPPIDLGPQAAGKEFQRADVEFEGVEHRGGSFEGRVFLNNPAAGEATPKTPEQGYAGSFHVYGFGLSPADLRQRDLAAAAGGRQEAAGASPGAAEAAAAPALGGEVRLPAARPGEPPPEAVQRTPARRYVIATDAVRRAIAKGGRVTVTVVPVTSGSETGGERYAPGGPGNPGDPGEHLRVDRAAIVFYN